MFVKLGQEKHLYDLMTKGEMFFNPCKYFRDLEEEQKQKGIGDGRDGAITAQTDSACFVSTEGRRSELNHSTLSVIVEQALPTPIFCMRKVDNEFISAEYRKKLKEQFPEHTHALIIRDEAEFLENIRYSFKNRVFAHSIFYQDRLTTDFISFLKNGSSDTRFYAPKPRQRYYMEAFYEPIDKSEEGYRFFIDDTNFYKTMYKKDLYFSDQKEYRLVLPYEEIETGIPHNIEPFNAELVSIDELVRDEIN